MLAVIQRVPAAEGADAPGSSTGESTAKLPPEDRTVALVAAETSEIRGLFGPGSPEENKPSPRDKLEGVSEWSTANEEVPPAEWDSGTAGDFKAEALARDSLRIS
jgi:hypothetical protein